MTGTLKLSGSQPASQVRRGTPWPIADHDNVQRSLMHFSYVVVQLRILQQVGKSDAMYSTELIAVASNSVLSPISCSLISRQQQVASWNHAFHSCHSRWKSLGYPLNQSRSVSQTRSHRTLHAICSHQIHAVHGCICWHITEGTRPILISSSSRSHLHHIAIIVDVWVHHMGRVGQISSE